MKPFLFDHRNSRTPLGVIARWWLRRRVARIKRARERMMGR